MLTGQVLASGSQLPLEATIEVATHAGEVLARATCDATGIYSFALEDLIKLNDEEASTLYARIEGFVPQKRSLWVKGVGYDLTHHIRRINFSLADSTIVKLQLQWQHPSPTGTQNALSGGRVTISQRGGRSSGFSNLARSTDIRRQIQVDGSVEFETDPSTGVVEVQVDIPRFPGWYRELVDISKPGLHIVKVPRVCNLEVDLRLLKAFDSRLSDAPNLQVLVNSTGGKSSRRISSVRKHSTVSNSVARFDGVQIGQTLDISVKFSKTVQLALASRYRVESQANVFRPSSYLEGRHLNTRSEWEAEGTRRPLRVHWSLVDERETPITGQDLGSFSLDSLRGLWRRENILGSFKLAQPEKNQRAAVTGSFEVRARPPISLELTGPLESQLLFIEHDGQTVTFSMPDNLLAGLDQGASFSTNATNGEQQSIVYVDLRHESSNLHYADYNFSSDPDLALDIRLPTGDYGYSVVGSSGGIAVGRCSVTAGVNSRVTVQFQSGGSVVGRLANSTEFDWVHLVSSNSSLPRRYAIFSERLNPNRSFEFFAVPPGAYSVVLSSRSAFQRATEWVITTMSVNVMDGELHHLDGSAPLSEFALQYDSENPHGIRLFYDDRIVFNGSLKAGDQLSFPDSIQRYQVQRYGSFDDDGSKTSLHDTIGELFTKPQ